VCILRALNAGRDGRELVGRRREANSEGRKLRRLPGRYQALLVAFAAALSLPVVLIASSGPACAAPLRFGNVNVSGQAAVGLGGPTATTSPCIANADHELLSDHPDVAVTLLRGCVASPTAVTVTSFAARTNESGLLGFNVYRWQGRRWSRLNAALVRARNAPGGSSYVYRDPVRSRIPLRYRLEVVRLDGSRARHVSASAKGR
jgi:hypothetical protein